MQGRMRYSDARMDRTHDWLDVRGGGSQILAGVRDLGALHWVAERRRKSKFGKRY